MSKPTQAYLSSASPMQDVELNPFQSQTNAKIVANL